MHLDLSEALTYELKDKIDSIISAGYDSDNLFMKWNELYGPMRWESIEFQAVTQQLAAAKCPLSALFLGLTLSSYSKVHGPVISDDFALYYLRLAFNSFIPDECDDLAYVKTKSNGDLFWLHICWVYLSHEKKVGSSLDSPTENYAFSFMADKVKEFRSKNANG